MQTGKDDESMAGLETPKRIVGFALTRPGVKTRLKTPKRVVCVIGLNVRYKIYEVLRLAYQNLMEGMCSVIGLNVLLRSIRCCDRHAKA